MVVRVQVEVCVDQICEYIKTVLKLGQCQKSPNSILDRTANIALGK